MHENAPRSLTVVDNQEVGDETSFKEVEEMGKACQQLMETLAVDGSFSSADWLDELQKYITKHKRILYSVVSAWVFQRICIDTSDAKEANKELLVSIKNNLKIAYSSIEKKDKTDGVDHIEDTTNTGVADNIEDKDEVAKKIILKLYDHVNLVTQQANFIDKNSQDLVKKIATESKQSFDEKINHSEQIYEQRIHDSEKNYVAILGIFAAVVLAFIGGLAFSTSVLSNMHRIPLYHSVCISIIIGMVLINILHFMFYCIERCMGKEDFKTSFKVLAGINFIFIILLACDFWAWKAGVIEKRDAVIEKAYSNSTQEQEDSSVHNTPPVVLQKETLSIFDANSAYK